MYRLNRRRCEIDHDVCRQKCKAERIRTLVQILAHQIRFGDVGRNKNISVVVGPTEQQIVPGCSKKFVVPEIATYRIVQTVAEQRVSTATADDVLKHTRGIQLQRAIRMHRLNRRRREIDHDICGQKCEAQSVDAFIGILRHLVCFGHGGRNKNIGVVVGSTEQQVVAAGANEFVVSGTAGQSIEQTVAKQSVSTSATDEVFNHNSRIERQRTIRMHGLNRRRREIHHDGCGQACKTQCIGAVIRQFGNSIGFGTRGCPEEIDVVTQPAKQSITPGAATQRVASAEAGQLIGV